MCFACYILLITSGSGEGNFLRSGFLRFFGTISYALYLIHQPISGLLHGFFLGKSPDINSIPQILVSLLALAVSIFIAWISWRVFESRLVAFGHRWQYHSLPVDEPFDLKPTMKSYAQP
jgi:peptidoglycan/LPS O-acetylase OafA/YrhL